ncbi:hypothetical protein PIB30_055866 [Stylosanthes scabra]|uniref:Uncharacterized protein n=1 Tax=Stylosanthes scabra TaxID=79078 RepID=A0ABU6UKS7_9FABA|nr:hypothetical protein [Stylosanthes scabra]
MSNMQLVAQMVSLPGCAYKEEGEGSISVWFSLQCKWPGRPPFGSGRASSSSNPGHRGTTSSKQRTYTVDICYAKHGHLSGHPRHLGRPKLLYRGTSAAAKRAHQHLQQDSIWSYHEPSGQQHSLMALLKMAKVHPSYCTNINNSPPSSLAPTKETGPSTQPGRKEDKREVAISPPRERGAVLATLARKNEARSGRRNDDNDAGKNGLAPTE